MMRQITLHVLLRGQSVVVRGPLRLFYYILNRFLTEVIVALTLWSVIQHSQKVKVDDNNTVYSMLYLYKGCFYERGSFICLFKFCLLVTFFPYGLILL